MQTRQIKAGSVDQSVTLKIIDDTTGVLETAVAFDTAGIDLKYRRTGAAAVSITEVTLAALTTAHTDGGFLHIGNGIYRLDLPDAAVAAGAATCVVFGTVTGMVVLGCEIELVANVAGELATGAIAAATFAAGAIDAAAIADNAIDAGAIATDAITAAKIAAGAIGASEIASDAIGAAELAADAITEIITAGAGNTRVFTN
jgi:hypothetical protein